MAKVSIVIPSRNERLLAKTVDDIFAKATGEIEVIVVLDGPTDYALPTERPRLTVIKKSKVEGLKPAINSGAKIATGKYLMKSDGHC
jgi:glycosyltransferase involved in cell wall biosynthesis